MTYPEALAYIASLEPRGWRLGLDRMQAFLERAGLSEAISGESPKFLHVAGTNGKGSVTAFLQSMLVAGGKRTGAFFSPYVFDPRERVQFGRDLISQPDFAELTAWLRPIAEAFTESEFGGITEFEFKTALGFAYWRKKQCEYVALEVGLGGRLDATNVVTPAASGIVSIGLDHVNILGHTHAEIAREKAGIIKPGKPVVVGCLRGDAMHVVERIAEERGCELWRYGQDIKLSLADPGEVSTPARTHRGLKPGMKGPIQYHNMAVAVAMLDAAEVDLDDEAIREGLANAQAPGRFQVLEVGGRTVVLDGAHNKDAAWALREALNRFLEGRKLRLVTNMIQGHEPGRFYQELPEAESVFVPPIDFHRARPVGEMAAILRGHYKNVYECETVREALEQALSGEDDNIVLVTGSFYLVGEAGNILMNQQAEGLPKKSLGGDP